MCVSVFLGGGTLLGVLVRFCFLCFLFFFDFCLWFRFFLGGGEGGDFVLVFWGVLMFSGLFVFFRFLEFGGFGFFVCWVFGVLVVLGGSGFGD